MARNDDFTNILRWLSALLVLFNIAVFGLLMFTKTATDISTEYYSYYWKLGLFCCVMSFGVFITDWGLRQSNELAETFFLFEKREVGNSTLNPAWLFVFMILAIVVAASVGLSKTAIFSTPNPYSASFSSLSTENYGLVTQHSGLLNFFTGAVVPGLYEDQAIFYFILALTFIVLLIWSIAKRQNMAEDATIRRSVLFIMMIVGSVVFSWAHGRYAGNTQAHVYAFLFEFLAQTLNMALGGFGSFIIHIAHNAAVITAQAFSFVAFMIIPPLPWWRLKRE